MVGSMEELGKGDPIKYPYHDYLFRAFVESWQKVTPEDILLWYSEKTLEEHIGCKAGLVDKYFATAKDFICDLERWWNLFTGMAVAKRIQAPPMTLEEMCEELRKRPGRGGNCIKETTVQKYLETVSSVLEDAKKNDIIPFNPAHRVRNKHIEKKKYRYAGRSKGTVPGMV